MKGKDGISQSYGTLWLLHIDAGSTKPTLDGKIRGRFSLAGILASGNIRRQHQGIRLMPYGDSADDFERVGCYSQCLVDLFPVDPGHCVSIETELSSLKSKREPCSPGVERCVAIETIVSGEPFSAE
jgi:hypothetical protein